MQVDVDKDEDELKRAKAGYAWESNNVRSWDQIEEDPETGRLKSFDRDEQIARKRRRDDGLSGVRRGIIRFCVLVLDLSDTMRATDLKPSRIELVCSSAAEFIREFFDQNPISQMCVVITRDAAALKVSSLSSNLNQHLEAVQHALRLGPFGTASLQNALDLARKLLAPIPAYGMREVIVAFGSMSTCDPGDIHATIAALVTDKVRCSAVGLGAELHILRLLTTRTGGSYTIAMFEDHFCELLSAHVIPPPTTMKQVAASLIRMGFPILHHRDKPAPYCNNPAVSGRIGYECPRCSVWLSEVPSECVLCGLTLVSSPHLARSYHHLFPVPKFVPVDGDSRGSQQQPTSHSTARVTGAAQGEPDTQQRENRVRCTGCLRLLDRETALRLLCPRCNNVFCIDCDAFVHDSLHYCPGGPGCGAQSDDPTLLTSSAT